MNPSVIEKLETLASRHRDIAGELTDPDVVNDQDRYRQLTTEYSHLESLVRDFATYKQLQSELDDANEMLASDDSELRDMANEEKSRLEKAIEGAEQKLRVHLLPKDPHDDSNVFLEVRAGTGGDEAAIFAGDLFRMYHRFVEHQNWSIEVLSASEGEHGGYREIITRIIGKGAYSKLKFESGAHRVQRVPETESQGRIHTSACTVAVLPELEAVEEVDINTSDLRIDTYRASGAGGQHVNKTDSAVRITHVPTGIVVECQDERSQHKNRARAMSLLQAKILDEQQQKQQRERAQQRKSLVGSGDRSERIRTYNFPQSRVTDHRINLTLYKLNEILDGHLENVTQPLTDEHQAELMAAVDGD
ncbi:MAG: peptide chain release factor 1 [Gammaproteobacteria bacterium]|nr:peptide chain release factor 1 [Gammaproteobacteria bacterium]